jgi:predicted ATP-grasp superfamily ATP-dependent carboligase
MRQQESGSGSRFEQAGAGSRTVLIAAISGRALAASARRGGYVPLVADFFGDVDTLADAGRHIRLASGLAHGIDGDELMAALRALAEGREPVGVVCGTGFEDRPRLLSRIAHDWPLLGNGEEVTRQVKDPETFAAVCDACGIPHAAHALAAPRDPEGWLAKRRGGSGGSHVTPAAGRSADAAVYFQERVPGTPVSALFLADGRRAVVLGFSAQWSAPAPQKPFRYGGAVRPASLSPRLAQGLAKAVATFVAAVPLVGLNSADFLVDGDEFRLMEINPRPGATLDIFEPPGGSLFALHLAACHGELPAGLPRIEGAAAAAIAYAGRDIASLAALPWPAWTADRPQAGIAVTAGDPLCTVLAHAATAAEATTLLAQRLETVLAWTHPSR